MWRSKTCWYHVYSKSLLVTYYQGPSGVFTRHITPTWESPGREIIYTKEIMVNQLLKNIPGWKKYTALKSFGSLVVDFEREKRQACPKIDRIFPIRQNGHSTEKIKIVWQRSSALQFYSWEIQESGLSFECMMHDAKVISLHSRPKVWDQVMTTVDQPPSHSLPSPVMLAHPSSDPESVSSLP